MKRIGELKTQKGILEKSILLKNYDWNKTQREHIELEKIDKELIELGYYDDFKKLST